jgi:glycosyltransferase involved in cell wall biosynthesis
MKISIITATYNSALTVKDTLFSIQEQDYPDIEHIIVDGHSADNTLELVNGYPHVAKVISEKDRGIYDAMNKGISLATGEVIGILNSDDIYTDSTVISSVAQVFSNPKIMTCYADLQYVHPADLNRTIRTWKSGPFHRRNFYKGWMPPHPTFFVRANVYREVGLFNLDLRSAADYEIMLRILLKHGVTSHYLPRIIVKMRAGGMSNASFRNRLLANKEDRLAWKLNGLKPYFFTTYLKPLRKIHQFIFK